MGRGYRFLFWGYFAVFIRINLFGIPILPAFAGWLIAMSGVRQVCDGAQTILGEDRGWRSLQLLRRARGCCGLMAVFSLATGMFDFFSAFGLWGIAGEAADLAFLLLGLGIQMILLCELLEGSAALMAELDQRREAFEFEGKIVAALVLFVIVAALSMAYRLSGTGWCIIAAGLTMFVVVVFQLEAWGRMRRLTEPFDPIQEPARTEGAELAEAEAAVDGQGSDGSDQSV